jgi:glycosidase
MTKERGSGIIGEKGIGGAAMERTRWYKNSVFYQVWPRSFRDGNGDGIGDLAGVLEKLDYIRSLGADGIWFSPLYPSPGADCGYDISDYMDINPEYGDLALFRQVLDGAHRRGMRVVMDLVVNHTSDEHDWFQKSRRRIAPYTDYYIWRPAKPDGGLPNNWDSMFEGRIWQWDDVRGEYYMHTFAVKQPDLNMDNPLVREEVKKILRFWLDMGVDGFREDVITFISKTPGLPDDRFMPVCRGLRYYNHGPRIHEYLSEFRRGVLADYDCMTLAEAPMITPRRALEYVAEPDGEIDMMIQFQCMCADCLFTDYFPTRFSLPRMKLAFGSWQRRLDGKAWNMLYLENHDHPRIISRYGSEKYRAESGKALCAAYMFLKGTPFIYQGQEIGMTNWRPADAGMYEDVQTRWQYKTWHPELPEKLRLRRLWRASRDSARTPMQWSEEENAGFSSGEPWFYVNPNYLEINAAAQENDPDSLLNFYREAVRLRKSLPVVYGGRYREWYAASRQLYVYERRDTAHRLLVICSFTENPVRFAAPPGYRLSEGELILKNYSGTLSGNGFVTKPWETRVYLF